jgi:hypothetical protein
MNKHINTFMIYVCILQKKNISSICDISDKYIICTLMARDSWNISLYAVKVKGTIFFTELSRTSTCGRGVTVFFKT